MTQNNVAWLFPGQGSQVVGMGQALAEHSQLARLAFGEANDALGFDLSALCWTGPQDELDRTANAQPALLTTSIAALRAAREAGMPERPVVAAGHSLGEFSALVALGVLALADAVRLVRRRGELMQEADPSGGMAAVIGLDAAAITTAIDGTGLVVANDNAPGQVVISGPLSAFPDATLRLKAAGAKRVLPLRVSAAFHSPAMRPVAPKLAAAMAEIRFIHPAAPVIANVDGQPHSDERELPGLLERQVWSPVRWVDVIRRAAGEGATTFVEFGAGTVLTGLTKRILPAPRTANVSDPVTLEEALTVRR
ncbi:MAG TPA: ACP S-malonyltransferase [Candidatus Saccharimonadales bacterium]|nr:ACP S-malonyltransferase [Candidatus Saccharimonadales bacterium]